MPSTTASNSDKGAVLLVVVLLWLLLSPDNSADVISVGDLAARRLEAENAALRTLNASRWGDFAPPPALANTSDSTTGYLNLTGFRGEDGFAWEALGDFKETCLRNSRHAIPPAGGKDLWGTGQGEAVWQNVSGYVAGTWARRDVDVKRTQESYNLTAIAPDVKWSGDGSGWARNVTGNEGRMKVRIHDKDGSQILAGVDTEHEIDYASVTVTMEDVYGSGSIWDMRLHGIHWPKQGALLLTTTSEKFDGIFALPHLAPGPTFFDSSQKLLNRTIGRRLKEKGDELFYDARIPWTSDDEDVNTYNPVPHCEYLMYAQVLPPDRQRLNMASFNPEKETMADIVRDIENELMVPLGAPTRGMPELQMSVLLFSPDCAFLLESKGPPDYAPVDGRHLVGMKAEVLRSKLDRCILAYAIMFLGQVYLLKQQIRETSTPSTMGRVSFYTGAMMLMADGLTVSSVMIFMISSDSSLQSLALMFSAFMSMLVGGAFLYKVYEVQQPDRARQQRQQISNANTPGRPGTPTAVGAASGSLPGSLPRPATAGPPRQTTLSPPVIIPSDQDIDAEIAAVADAAAAVPTSRGTGSQNETTFGSLVGRFILTGTTILFLLIASTTWYKPYRSFLLNLIIFIYLSLWVPQIYRNVLRNSRRALSWRFAVGQSVLRLLPVAYIYCRDDNVLFVETDRQAFAVFAGWIWIQLWILAFQDVLGPRFGVPRSWTPDAWDYHPILREDALEAGRLPIGLMETASPAAGVRSASTGGVQRKEKGNVRVIDCAICREDLEVHVVKMGDDDPSAGGVAGVLQRRGYMVTPCRHIFHSQCLEGWMRFRLQCPICREDLPPL